MELSYHASNVRVHLPKNVLQHCVYFNKLNKSISLIDWLGLFGYFIVVWV